MDHVAGVLKMPTEQLREINMFREGEETHFTQILEKCQVGLRPADGLSNFTPPWEDVASEAVDITRML